jgi:two-component system alkaline phosphatase synthesis response regulator PhoP
MQDTILLVEDEAAIAAFVQTALEREGFAVEVVEDGQQALARVNQALPDLIILDLMLPGMDGLEVCRAVRRMPTYVPIIMLTARTEDVDKVVGLELGADDYITKPFNTRELIARVRAVLRLADSRATMEEPDRLRIGRLEIDMTGRTVTVGGQPVDLTPKEFDLLVLLASHPGRVFGRETLLEKVWGYDYLGDSRTVDVHVQRLRRKLEEDPHHPRYLLTVRSIGYKFAREDVYSEQRR